jgi:hypothetical protein
MANNKWFEFLKKNIENDIAVAEAAGHGFSHRPVGERRNAGWTELDDFANTRSGYDKAFLKLFNPERMIKESKTRLIELEFDHKNEHNMESCDCGEQEPCSFKTFLAASYDWEEWAKLHEV